MLVKRALLETLKYSKKSILLIGPRQAGKTTLIRELQPDLIIDLARETEFLKHSADAGLLPSLIEGRNTDGEITVFVDEIQRIPTLLNTIQALLDEAIYKKKPLKFYLTGSSARKLRRGQANLLPGRVLSYRLLPLSLEEISSKNLNWNRGLLQGFLPEAYLSSERDAKKLLTTYSATYVKEEIQAEAMTRNLQGFARFLSSIAASAGDVLDFTKLAQRSKIARSTCIRFMEILEDTLLAERLEVFNEAEGADVIRHPRVYFFDVGVLNGLLGGFSITADRLGLLTEHAVYNQLRNTAASKDVELNLFYFRTRHGLEVDFIAKLNQKIWAIEVKSGSVSEKDTKALIAFKEYYPDTHRMVIFSPAEKMRRLGTVTVCNPMESIEMMNW